MIDREPRPCDLLIYGGLVLSVDADNTVLQDGAVAVIGTRIAEVGPSDALRARYRGRETINARGAVVHPGFIDAHVHVSQYAARSALRRMAGTRTGMGDWKAALTPEDEHASARLAALDYLRSGYTGFVDPGTVFEPDAVAQAALESGIRLWLTDPYVADRGHRLTEHLGDLVSPGFLRRWPRDTDEALARLGAQLPRNASDDGLVHAFIGIYGDGTASPELYRAALELARRRGVQFQEHRGYLPASYLAEERAHGVSAIRRLNDDGVLGQGTTFIHMNVVHADEVPLIAGSGTGVVWCPYGQLQMIGKGDAEPRMPELHRAGAPVGLATDIPRVINFDALGALAVANAAACGTPVDGLEVLRMRTIGAATTIGGERTVGSLEAGKVADIVVGNACDTEALGVDPAWETAVHGRGRAPAAVIVNGTVVLRAGVPLKVDPADSARLARSSVRGLINRIGL